MNMMQKATHRHTGQMAYATSQGAWLITMPAVYRAATFTVARVENTLLLLPSDDGRKVLPQGRAACFRIGKTDPIDMSDVVQGTREIEIRHNPDNSLSIDLLVVHRSEAAEQMIAAVNKVNRLAQASGYRLTVDGNKISAWRPV